MNITPVTKGALTYLIVDDFYSAEELDAITGETLDLLVKAQTPPETGASKNNDGSAKKTAKGVFVDDLFINTREQSKILTINRKIFSKYLIAEAKKLNSFFGVIETCNFDCTLLNFYANGDSYAAHDDLSPITAVTFIDIGNVSGGDFTFAEFDETVKFKNNRVVIFAGCTLHEAKPTIAENGAFRVSMVQFLGYR